MSSAGAFSWNSELPSGRSPFWIRDDGLAGRGLRAGDAVSVDTGAEPGNGELVVVEVEQDGDSSRLARRYATDGGEYVRLETVSEDGTVHSKSLPETSVMIMGVIRGRLRFSADGSQVIEEPLDADP